MKPTILLALTCFGMCSCPAAQAAAFINGSFEMASPLPGDGAFLTYASGSTAITGWTVTLGSVDLINDGYYPPDFLVPDGDFSIDLNGLARGAIAQTFDTIKGQKYTVSFDQNSNSQGDTGRFDKSVAVTVGDFGSLFLYPAGLHPQGIGGPWLTRTFTFTALEAQSTLTFTSLYLANCCNGALIDNVKVSGPAGVSGPVPEPASWAMMIGGFALAGAAIRRSRCPIRVA